MFIVANRIPVSPDWAARFEQRFKQRADEIHKQPGFIRMEILRPVQDNAPYVVSTAWEDQHAFENWIESDDFRVAHENPLPREAFTGKPQLEKHEVVISSIAPNS